MHESYGAQSQIVSNVFALAVEWFALDDFEQRLDYALVNL
jgi:hypothetical protein